LIKGPPDRIKCGVVPNALEVGKFRIAKCGAADFK
jgi:hypothetical protein